MPLWDVTFIEETHEGVRAQRFARLKDAPPRGRARLRKELPFSAAMDSHNTGSTCVIEYKMNQEHWDAVSYTNVSLPLNAVLQPYIDSRAGSVLVAWNLRGHDRHVLSRAVGDKTLNKLMLWDALPWFRRRYTLPKNTMASNKAGTPRNVFDVPSYGSAHGSLADAAHMRDVVMRAAYCYQSKDSANISAHKQSTRLEQLDCVHEEIESIASDNEWSAVVCSAWSAGLIPKSIYQAPRASAKDPI